MVLSCYSDVSSLSVHLQLIIGSLRNDGGKGNDSDNATNHSWLKEEATMLQQQCCNAAHAASIEVLTTTRTPIFSFSRRNPSKEKIYSWVKAV